MQNYKYTSTVYAKSSTKILPWRREENYQDYYSNSQSLKIKTPDNYNYVITTNHSIPNNSRKIFLWDNTDENNSVLNKLKLLRRSQISDIALLEIGNIRKKINNKIKVNEVNKSKFLPITKISKRVPKSGNILYFTIKLKDSYRPLMIELIFEQLGFENMNGSPNIPLTPVLMCSFKDKIPSEYLHGFSGSPVFYKKKMVGIISNINRINNKIILVPSFLVLKIINDQKNNIAEEIKYINLPISETNEGLMINKDCSNRLKKGYVIEKLNYRNLDKNNMVYSPEIQHKVPWNTYLMTIYKGDTISLYIKAPTLTGKSHFSFPIKKKVRNMNNFLKIDNIFKNDFINIYGLIFCELTFPLIKYFFENNIMLKGPSMEKIYNNYTSKSNKEIIMVDYMGNQDIFKGQMTKNMNIEDFTRQNILKLTKFGNKKIKNLMHMREIVKFTEKKIISLEVSDNSIININY